MFIFRRGLSNKEENIANLTLTPTSKKTFSFASECTDVTHSSIQSESLTLQPPLLNEFLDLEAFKIQPCPHTMPHNFKNCTFFHNFKDCRRPGGFYSSDLCPNIDDCGRGDTCPYSHNYIEQMYQKDKYKTRFCGFYPNNLRNCEYGGYCSFAHSEQEILVDLLHNYEMDEDFFMFHYKTVWCPFNLNLHDKTLCVYAHNWQDFRRKPQLFDYDTKGCGLWKYNDVLTEYTQGCPNGLTCKYSHGWKESEFHPLNYKIGLCNMANCLKGLVCPGFHNMKERRVLSINVMSKLFKIYPRNRVVAGTFKVRKENNFSNNKAGLSHRSSEVSALDSIREIKEENILGRNETMKIKFNDYMNDCSKKMKVMTPEHKNEFKSKKDFRRASENVMNKGGFLGGNGKSG